MKLDLAIEELHSSENHLVTVLTSMSDKHEADHEVFYVCRDMSAWSRRHVAELARVGRDFGLDLDPEASEDPALLASMKQRASELTGRRSVPGLLLLADLRHLYREAAGSSVDWELLAHGAQGPRRQSSWTSPSAATRRPCGWRAGPTRTSRSPHPRCWPADVRSPHLRRPPSAGDAAAARCPGPGVQDRAGAPAALMDDPAAPMDDGVLVRVPPELAFLLPARTRGARARRMSFDPDATVGHLVQAAGVPLTEAGDLLLDGRAVSDRARPGPGSTIEVGAAPRPQVVPPGGFLLDVGLGALARRLRLLGQDAAWSAGADDADLALRAVTEERLLLTQDRGLLKRRVLGRTGGALVRGARPDEQLTDLLDRFTLDVHPSTRCTACGARLEHVAKAEVADLLPPGTRRSYDDFARCTSCGQVYWRGAHARRIDALVADAQDWSRLGGTTRETDRGAPRR